MNTGRLPFGEVESEYDVPWRSLEYPLAERINQGGTLDLNFACLDPAFQQATDGLAAHRQLCALKNWKVEQSPEQPHYPAVARLRLQSPSAGDAGWFERFVPHGFSLGFRIVISAKNLPATAYLGEIIPVAERLFVAIDKEADPPLDALSMLVEMGDDLHTKVTGHSATPTALERSCICEDWRVASHELIERRLGRSYTARMRNNLSSEDHSGFTLATPREVRIQVFAMESDLNWIRQFIAESTG